MSTTEVPIEIVSATRLNEEDFWLKSALGLSLMRMENDQRIKAHISFSNRRGLPEVYNRRIDAKAANDSNEAILVFIHDDVWLEDFFLPQRLDEATQQFDIIGVAGNRERKMFQPMWGSAIATTKIVSKTLSGMVAHGTEPLGLVSNYGPTPASCKLLDGVFLAAKRNVLINHSVHFDTRFEFHFYDLDFCRSAEQQGLSLGTWPICLTHQSHGSFKNEWHEAYKKYIDKWGS